MDTPTTYTQYGYRLADGSADPIWCRRDTAEKIVKNRQGYVLVAQERSEIRVVSVRGA